MAYGSFGPGPDLDALLDEVRERDQMLEAPAVPVNGNRGRTADPRGPQPTRNVSLVSISTVQDDVPRWVWRYEEKGRIPVGGLCIAAGRPGAGKSTWGRWIVAGYTTGTIPGEWEGRPVNAAYLAAEESARYTLKPGLRAAGADMARVFLPVVTFEGEETKFLSGPDMDNLTEQLVAADVRVVVLDPMMSTLGGKTDINKNNEVRSLVEPWAKLAEKIDGIVIAIAHLNKSGSGDVVAGINGSSAFGEVARTVFGFAKDTEGDEGDRVMSQEKNSIGDEDLAITYRIESTPVTTDSGKTADVGRFVLVGNSERTVADVLRANAGGAVPAASNHAEIDAWLLELLADGPMLAKEVYSSAGEVGYSTDKAKRSKERINKEAERIKTVKIGNPAAWFWERADAKGARDSEQGVTPLGAAPLLPCVPLQVSGGDQGGEYPQGSKSAGSTGVGEPPAPLPCPSCSSPLGTTGKCVACIVGKASGEAVA